MSVKVVRNVLFSVAAIVLVWAIVAPLLCPYGTVTGLDGTVAVIDHWSLWSSMNPFSAAIYVLGDFFCHQMQDRTFMLNGNELPFCVRDIALLIGFSVGMMFVSTYGIKRSRYTDIYIISSIVLILADWGVQRVFLLNWPASRMITGILAGIAIALFICFVLNAMAGTDSNNKVYK